MRDGSGRPAGYGRFEMRDRAERDAMAELLVTIPWQVYLTWTFRHSIGPDGALREILRWLSFLSWSFAHKLGWMVGLEHDLGAEWCHGHGLALALGDDLADTVKLYQGKPHERAVPLLEPFWFAWHRRHGRGKFELIDGRAGHGVSFYCSKYAAKRGDVVFSTGLEAFRGAVSPASPVMMFPEVGR